MVNIKLKMINSIKKYLENLFNKAVNFNHKVIVGLLEKKSDVIFLDLGCNDGILTMGKAN